MAEITKNLEPKTMRPPRITWKAVEPRHYQRARDYLADSKEAYTAFVLRLVETWDFENPAGLPIPVTLIEELSKAQLAQVLAAFEAEFGPAAPKEGGEK